MTRQHARLGPSSASRWSVCHGAPNAEEGLPDESSPAGREGTFAHSIREAALKSGQDCSELIGTKATVDGYEYECDDVMAAYLQEGIDRIRKTVKGKWYVERLVYLKPWLPGQFGTMDFGSFTSKLLLIDDLKYGAGDPISAYMNKQLALYLMGFWETIAKFRTDATDVVLRIDQPRAPGGGGEWSTNLKTVRKLVRELSEDAKLTYKPDAKRVPGVIQCRWCKAAETERCPEYDAYFYKTVLAGLPTLEEDEDQKLILEDPDRMDPAKRSLIIKHAPAIRLWLERLHDRAMLDAEMGNPVPFLKRIQGRRGPRQWADPERAERALRKLLGREERKQIYKKTLRGPAQLEKVLGPVLYEQMKSHIRQSDGKISLVADTDRRKEVPSVISLLPDLTKKRKR